MVAARHPAILWLAALSLLFAVVVATLYVHAPLYAGVVGLDPGVFLYTAEQMQHGAVPYRDLWDHKPPGIYYIDALGLGIGGGAAWGVWLLEVVALYAAAVLGFVTLKRAFGALPAVFATAVWIGGVAFVIQGGNHTEEFALPLQFAALYLFWQAERRGSHAWRGFLIGLTLAGCFLLRQNLIGVHLAIVVVLALTRAAARRWRALAVSLASIAAGAAAAMALVVVYFAAQGALAALWDQAFRYNVVYAGKVGVSYRLMALAVGLYTLAPSGAAIAAIAGWLIALLLLLRNRERLGPGRPLVLVALAGLPLEMGLSALSGFPFPHYFTALLPTCAVLAGFIAYSLASGEGRERALGRALVVVALVAAMILPLWQGVTMVTTPSSEAAQDRAVVEYVTRATGEDDTVLIWGALSKLNYMAHRRSPTRYHYQYPLYMPGYQTAPMVAQFLAEIEANRPALIIDTASPSGWLPPLDPAIRAGWAPGHFYTPLPEMEAVYAYIEANYRVIGAVGWMQWPVYAPVGREVSAP